MGLLNIFKKKPEQITLTLETVSDWLDEYIEKQEISLQINVLRRELYSKTTKLKELLNELAYAKIRNEKIPEREMSIFEGNRKAYIQKVGAFMEKIKVPPTYNEVKDFLMELSRDLDELGESTSKNYYALKHFMEDEARKVAVKLQEIDRVVIDSIAELEKTALDKAAEVKDQLNVYYHAEKEIEEYKKHIQAIEKKKLERFGLRAAGRHGVGGARRDRGPDRS